MTIENIKIEEAIERVRKLLSMEKEISPALKAAIEVMMYGGWIIKSLFIG